MGHPARRALSPEEIQRVLAKLDYPRDKAMLILGLATGYRISELLSLRVKDVWEFGRVREQISVPKASMKAKKSGRSCWLHPDAQAALGEWLAVLGTDDPQRWLFASTRYRNQPLSRCQAWRVLKDAFAAAEVGGETGTHSLRKTYAQAIYAMSNQDLNVAQKALGHVNVQSTVSYLANVDDKLKQIVTGRKLF